MKKRINLFNQRGDPLKNEGIFLKIRTGSYILLLLLLVSLIGLVIFEQQLINRSKTLKYNQTVATHKLQTNNKGSDKIKTLLSNKVLLDKHLKDDASFLPYYNLLNNLLLSTEGEPALGSLTLNNKRETTFTISFAKYEDMSEFLRTAETPVFSQYFEKIKISPFSVSENSEYKLQLEGTFKPIHAQ